MPFICSKCSNRFLMQTCVSCEDFQYFKASTTSNLGVGKEIFCSDCLYHTRESNPDLCNLCKKSGFSKKVE